MEDDDPASGTGAMTFKVKSQGRKVTWSVWALLAQCCTCVISGRWGPTVSAEPGGHTPCFDLRRMTSVRCIRCVAYGSLEPTLKSRFHGPTCGFQVVLRNTRNATDARLATQSKNRNTQRMHTKNTTHAIDFIFCMRCVFRVHALRVLRPVRCVRQLGNRPLSQFSAFWWRRLCFDVWHV